MLTARIKHFDFNSPGFGRSGSVRAKTKLALHPLNDRRQCQAGRVLIGFAKPDILYSQSASKGALGVYRCTMTPTKPAGRLLDSLSDGDCKRSHETELRMSDGFFRFQAKTTSARKMINS
jgi:hypothetical protein